VDASRCKLGPRDREHRRIACDQRVFGETRQRRDLAVLVEHDPCTGAMGEAGDG
jgi:hypothetical protein